MKGSGKFYINELKVDPIFYMDMLNDTHIMGEIVIYSKNNYHIDPAVPLVVIDDVNEGSFILITPSQSLAVNSATELLDNFVSICEINTPLVWIEFCGHEIKVFLGRLDEGHKPVFYHTLFLEEEKLTGGKEGTIFISPSDGLSYGKLTEFIWPEMNKSSEYKMNDGNVNYTTTNDPIENYMNLKKLKNNILLDDVTAINRTLVVVYADSKSKKDYKERIDRFIGGLNTAETIKAVVITVSGDKIYQGVTFENPPSDEKIDPHLLEAIKSKFVQVIEVKNGNG